MRHRKSDTGSLTADLLSIYQAAAALGVSVSTVHAWTEAGKMPAPIEFGGRQRWRLSELKKWVDAGCPHREPEQEKRGRVKA
jgi:excisionase family DNA binding protein